MMKIIKRMLILLLMACLAIGLLIGKVQAAELKVEKSVTSTNGSISFTITGLTLDSGSNYEWAIETNNNTDTITDWYDVTAPDYQLGKVEITVSIDNEKQLEVLKKSNIGYISIRKKGETTNKILSAKQVDLELPLMKAFTITRSKFYDRNVPDNPAYEVNGPYGLEYSNIQFCFERITDASVVNGYIDQDHDLSGLKLKGKSDIPANSNTNWKSLENIVTDQGVIKNKYLPLTDGLYYIWFKGSSTGVKTVYGQMVVEVGEVKRIEKEEDKDKNDTDKGNTNSDGNTNKGNTNSGNTNKGTNTNKNGISGTNTNQQKSNTQNTKDPTVAQKTLPQTGISIGIIFIITLVCILGIIGYVKLRYYNDIK